MVDADEIDLTRLEQRHPDYLKINPNGFVPTLAHGERVVFESNVITEYLDDAFPERPLYPDDPWELAQVRMWQASEAALAKDFRTIMYQRLMGPIVRLTRTLDEALAAARRSTDDPADLAWEERVWRLEVLTPEEEQAYEDRLRAWLKRLDQALEGRNFLVGDRFGQAEISVYPRVMMFPFVWLEIQEDQYPNVRAWMERLSSRSSFSKTLPSQDRGLLQLSRTGIMPWLRRSLEKPQSERRLGERAGLAALRLAFKQILGGETESTESATTSIRMPSNGEIAPETVGSRRLPPAHAHREERGKLVLFDHASSPHARRIRILLRLKGVDYERVPVDLLRLEHKTPAYLGLNPNGELPALRHGNRVLFESQLIAEYVDQSFGEPGGRPLLPADAFEAAQVRMWLALEAGTHKEFRPLFNEGVVRRGLVAAGVGPSGVDSFVAREVDESHRKALRALLEGHQRFDTSAALAREIVRGKVDQIETHLSGRHFFVGDGLSLADLAWYTRIDLFPELGIELEEPRFTNVNRWYESMSQRLEGSDS